MIIHPIKAEFYIQHCRQEAGSSSSFILLLCQTGLSTLYQDKPEDLKQTKNPPKMIILLWPTLGSTEAVVYLANL